MTEHHFDKFNGECHDCWLGRGIILFPFNCCFIWLLIHLLILHLASIVGLVSKLFKESIIYGKVKTDKSWWQQSGIIARSPISVFFILMAIRSNYLRQNGEKQLDWFFLIFESFFYTLPIYTISILYHIFHANLFSTIHRERKWKPKGIINWTKNSSMKAFGGNCSKVKTLCRPRNGKEIQLAFPNSFIHQRKSRWDEFLFQY